MQQTYPQSQWDRDEDLQVVSVDCNQCLTASHARWAGSNSSNSQKQTYLQNTRTPQLHLATWGTAENMQQEINTVTPIRWES